jgi:murein DD-endopeptidase MepM/ murein hydrolase activator NlpD
MKSLHKGSIHPKKIQPKLFGFALLSILILFFLSLVACQRENKGFEPFIVSNQNQSTQKSTPLPTNGQETASPQITAQITYEPRITMTPAAFTYEPTPMVPQVLPALRTSEDEYTIKSGDTLAAIAQRHQVSVKQIVERNEIEDPNLIEPDDLLLIPPASANEQATSFRIIPDSEIIYGPSVKDFDIASIIWQFNGKLNRYQEEMDDETELSGAEIVRRVANEQSVNPRLLLALLEHQSGCLRSPSETCDLEEYPLGLKNNNQKGLYKQLSFAANELLRGMSYWQNNWVAVWTLADGDVMRVDPGINAGTAALQHLFSLLQGKEAWKRSVSETGFYQTYQELFGYPFAFTIAPLIPDGLSQPELILPLKSGDVWLFTSGPHWAWGTGSAWSALDFAPPGNADDYGCYFSDAPVLAAADGVVVRSEGAAVIIDLDGDGYEQTGWTLNYFHIDPATAIPAGTIVATGDVIGRASCEGGVTNGTHFHLSRRYNGVWIQAGGGIPFNLGGWVASSYGSVYDGSLVKDGVTIEAYNGRSEINEISNP